MSDSSFDNLLVCPNCHSTLENDGTKQTCPGCGSEYKVSRGIPDFRQKDDYWCNVSREKMHRLNQQAKATGDWLSAAREIIPEYADHFIPFYRADSQFLWPTNKCSRILDAGSMWGGLTIPAAQFHGEVYAVDKTVETLEFLKIRAGQMGFDNIRTVAASLKSLPFPDNFFDHVILNGVLEWVGMEEDVILEKHWKGKRIEKQVYSKTPREMQIDALKELNRRLTPEGSLYIAIENRYGIQYFLTSPDNHNNVRFISFLPRQLSNLISRLVGKGAYRTYTYSPSQLLKILNESGFNNTVMYGVSPHYIQIQKAFPLKMSHLFKNQIKVQGVLPRILHKVIKPFVPASISHSIVPSLLTISTKAKENDLQPRIQDLLIKANVLNKNDDISFAISNNRFENCNSTNIIIYDRTNKPLHFCKISRDAASSGMRDEAENIEWLSNRLTDAKDLSFQLPELIYYGKLEGIEILVTTFIRAKNINLTSHYIINKGLDKIKLSNQSLKKCIAAVEEKIFLKRLNKKIRPAIDVLVDFQQVTVNGQTTIKEASQKIIDDYLASKTPACDKIRQALLSLTERVKLLPEIEFTCCSTHGDYDTHNILFVHKGKAGLIDFEHLEKTGYPFFDLATLIFHPLLIKWKTGVMHDKPFAAYLKKYGIMKYVVDWLKYYCDKRTLPHSLIPIIPSLAVIEQNTKVYPPSRNPDTFPMYGESALKEVLSIEVNENI